MKIKKEFLILGAVIVALAVYLFQRSSDRTHYTLPTLPDLPAADITKIQLARPGETVTLKRHNAQWELEPQGYPADSKSVQEMLETMAGLNLTALVAESKNYALYELDDEHKVNVKIWQNDQLRRDVDVGKAAPSFRHTYIRLAGDDRVFQAADNFSFRFRAGIEDLRDKTVLAFNRQDIREVRISSGDQSVTLTRIEPKKEEPASAPAAPDEWQGSDGLPANRAVVESLLSELSNLRCDTFINDRDKAAFSNPAYSILLKGPQDYSLSIFAPANPDSQNRPAVSSGSDYAFQLSEDHAKRITKNPEDFFKTEKTN